MSIKVPNLKHKDLTKLLLLYYLIDYNLINSEFTIKSFSKYVYRFYSDNPEYAKCHPSIVINNIGHYGVDDIVPFVKQELEEWKKQNNESCLVINNNKLIVLIENNDNKLYAFTKSIADMLFIKFTNTKFDYKEEISELNNLTQYDLDYINSTRLVNRILENMQYCVCCDKLDDLKVVNLSDNIELINNYDNYVLVCHTHFELYKEGYYKFDKNGHILIVKQHPLINSKMHISKKNLI